MKDRIQIVRIGEDPFGRDELTVFYRDLSVSETEVFYLWVKRWPPNWPPLPPA